MRCTACVHSLIPPQFVLRSRGMRHDDRERPSVKWISNAIACLYLGFCNLLSGPDFIKAAARQQKRTARNSVYRSLRRAPVLLSLAVSLSMLTACGGASVSYEPPFAPVDISISTQGAIQVGATKSVVTEWGTFSATGSIAKNLKPESNVYWLTIRHKQGRRLVDTVYQIHANQELTVVVNGKASLNFSNSNCFVDASSGVISSIVVRSIQEQPAVPGSTATSTIESVPPPPTNVAGGHTDPYNFKIWWTNVSLTATMIYICVDEIWEGRHCAELPPSATRYRGHTSIAWDAEDVDLWACRGNICSASPTYWYIGDWSGLSGNS
jgi:hypothetical protein